MWVGASLWLFYDLMLPLFGVINGHLQLWMLFFFASAAFSAASYVPYPDFNCRSTAT